MTNLGKSYEGQFKENAFDGLGTLTYANGEKHVGSFREGQSVGFGILYSADGKILKKGFWKEDNFIGETEN